MEVLSTTPAIDDPDSQELLSMQLKGKKKKPKKKVDIASLEAEIEKLAAEGTEPTVPNANTESTHLSSSAVVQEKEPVGQGIDDELGLNLAKKKKKRKVKLDDPLTISEPFSKPTDAPAPPTATPSYEPSLEPIQDTSQPLVDYVLPLKKKKRKSNIVFEGFEIIRDSVVDEDWENTKEKPENDLSESDDIESMDSSPWAGSDRDYSYEELLERVFNIMKQKNPGMVERKTRLVMKPPQVMRVGARRTTFANFTDICKLLHRQPKHVFAFLLAELGTNGSIDGNNQLIIKGRFQQKQIETVLKRYIKEYVTCHTCRSPETILQRENRLFFLQCETCGSRCSVQSVKSGFQAVTNRAQMRSRQT